ncbi:MAG: chemotaxis protein [Alphaproteobacteria bacterium]|nr:chemotaxis protein [Alphaproteobacteria bacterium]MBU1281409.1 chemotaxis protein [Alphaproteobacteria bacterium]MBU1571924.1 chemotaxis protein [Alphaproteobacteria bacterium]MBU1829427.1 chemotaxis protein [Alphaproteobacteria bacterium]MBU2078332.1 chemotaxis protein [Alphaproteobacteria bacterium]
MIPNPDFENATSADHRMSLLAKYAGRLGFEVVDIAGFLDSVDEQSKSQIAVLADVQSSATDVMTANGAVRDALTTVTSITDQTLNRVEGSVGFVRESGQKSQHVASWVKDLSERMERVASSLSAVEADNTNIADIARQVNILAINAKIEAARAGDSGRGFGVVAEAINELSRKTARAAAGIEENIATLSEWVGRLREEATGVSTDASHVISSASETDLALTEIAQGVRQTHDATRIMVTEADKVRDAVARFQPAFDQIGKAANATAEGIHVAHERVDKLINTSETIFQTTVALGGASEDLVFINKVQEAASRISALFADGINSGRISRSDLFDQSYVELANTNPQQYMARFTAFTDEVLPAVQEPMLEFNPKVVFCAALDPNGYLPTHNVKFSAPQGHDPAWNAANSRNRRIFSDRVGLKAGRNTEPFLLQVYRRDMGAGKFMMMKDLSAPIVVDGKHWGGLRLGYTF